MHSELKKDLIELLKEEKELYQKLFEIAEVKNESLLANDTESLTKSLAKDQEVIEKIEAKEKLRKELVAQIQTELNLELKDNKYSDLIEKVPLAWKADLKEIRTELIKLTDEFYALNDQNQKLLKQALEVNTFSIESILKSIKDNKQTYGQNDKDKKEQPRLLNKQV